MIKLSLAILICYFPGQVEIVAIQDSLGGGLGCSLSLFGSVRGRESATVCRDQDLSLVGEILVCTYVILEFSPESPAAERSSETTHC